MDKPRPRGGRPARAPWVTRAIENAQQKVEAYNFDIRKHVVEYDDVLNRQRDVIYGDRDRVLFEDNLKPLIMEWVEETLVMLTEDSAGRRSPRAGTSTRCASRSSASSRCPRTSTGRTIER